MTYVTFTDNYTVDHLQSFTRGCEIHMYVLNVSAAQCCVCLEAQCCVEAQRCVCVVGCVCGGVVVVGGGGRCGGAVLCVCGGAVLCAVWRRSAVGRRSAVW